MPKCRLLHRTNSKYLIALELTDLMEGSSTVCPGKFMCLCAKHIKELCITLQSLLVRLMIIFNNGNFPKESKMYECSVFNV